jgi:O-antigen ligase
VFIFTLPYDAADLGFMTGDLSIAKISGLLFFVFYFCYYGPLSQQRSFPCPASALWWFLIYVIIFALHGFFEPAELADKLSFSAVLTLAQLLVFFWITSDLLKDEKMARRILLTYAIATSLVALGMVAGLPGFSTDVGQGRVEAMEDNPNTSGQHMALSALILIGLTLNGTFKRLTSKVLLPLLVVLLLAGIVGTGSRSAVGAFVIGCSVYLLPHLRSRRLLMSILLATLGIGAAIYMVVGNADFLERWSGTYYEGETSGRDEIYGAAIEMISERPIFGWHPVGAFYELGVRMGVWHGKDAHNLFLDLLLGLGLIGAIPFLIGLWLCARAAWRARTQVLGMLPLALIAANLAASMFHTNLTWKPQWFVLALTFAATSSKVSGSGKPSAMLVARRSIEPVTSS